MHKQLVVHEMEVLGVLESYLEERVRNELMVHFETRALIWMDFLDDFWVSFFA